jgi:hypothetical protein
LTFLEYLPHLFFSPLDPSFNQPNFCSTAVWNRNGITFANQTTLGSNPFAIFVNEKDSVYTINREKKQILVWNENNTNPTLNITTDFSNSSSLFVTVNGDIYIDNGALNGRVEKWTASSNGTSPALFISSSCKGLFVDRNDNLYCSLSNHHHVAKGYMDALVITMAVVAGTGFPGSAENELNHPHGIFVDVNFDLYVADCENDRVQLFQSGQSHGITIAGGLLARGTTSLSCPTGITFDGQKYLFIVDSNNHRIVRTGPNGIRCVVGCSGIGSQSIQLFSPSTISFDRSGNMFVVDAGNHRIQKFEYSQKSCGKF